MSGTQRYAVRLTCDHVTMFRHTSPKTGDLVYCLDCRDYRNVAGRKSAVRRHWRIHCIEEGCIFTRKPSHREVAIRTADSHSLRKSHRVEVYDTHDNLVRTIMPISAVTKT